MNFINEIIIISSNSMIYTSQVLVRYWNWLQTTGASYLLSLKQLSTVKDCLKSSSAWTNSAFQSAAGSFGMQAWTLYTWTEQLPLNSCLASARKKIKKGNLSISLYPCLRHNTQVWMILTNHERMHEIYVPATGATASIQNQVAEVLK